jgi:hypothetical protein
MLVGDTDLDAWLDVSRRRRTLVAAVVGGAPSLYRSTCAGVLRWRSAMKAAGCPRRCSRAPIGA